MLTDSSMCGKPRLLRSALWLDESKTPARRSSIPWLFQPYELCNLFLPKNGTIIFLSRAGIAEGVSSWLYTINTLHGPAVTVIPLSDLMLIYPLSARHLALYSAMSCRKLGGDASWQMYQNSPSLFVQIADLGQDGARADFHYIHGHAQSQKFG